MKKGKVLKGILFFFKLLLLYFPLLKLSDPLIIFKSFLDDLIFFIRDNL